MYIGSSCGIIRVLGDVSETVISVLNCYFATIIEISQAYGGHVMKFAGDAVQIFFEEEKGTSKNTPLLAIASSLEAIQAIPHIKLPVHLIKKPKVKFALCHGTAELVIVGGVWARYEYFLAGKLVEQVGQYASYSGGNDVVIAKSLGAWFCPVTEEYVKVDVEFAESSSGKEIIHAANELLLKMRVANSFFARSSRTEGNLKLDQVEEGITEINNGLYTMESKDAQSKRHLRQRFFTGRMLEENHAEGVYSFVPVCVLLEITQRIDFAGIRHLSVLFLEVHELRDAKTDLDKMQSVVTEVQVAVYAANGAIRQVMIDDKGFVIIAFFGLTTTRSPEPDAMKAAIRLLQVLPDIDLRVGMGLASGDCFHGNVGAPSRHEFAIVGQVVNRSARLMSQASKIVKRFPVTRMQKAGEAEPVEICKCALLCDELTRQHAFGGQHMVKFAGISMRLKGLSEPINVYQPVVKSSVADTEREMTEALDCGPLQPEATARLKDTPVDSAQETEELIPLTLLKIVSVMSCHASLLHEKILEAQVEEKSLRLALEVHLSMLCQEKILRLVHSPGKIISMYNENWFIYLGGCYEVIDRVILRKVYARCLEAYRRKMHLQIARTYDTLLAKVRCPIRSSTVTDSSSLHDKAHHLFKIIALNYLSSGCKCEAARNLLLAAEDLARLQLSEDSKASAQQALTLYEKDAMARYKNYSLSSARCLSIMAQGVPEASSHSRDQCLSALAVLRIPCIGLMKSSKGHESAGSRIVITHVEGESVVTDVVKIEKRTLTLFESPHPLQIRVSPLTKHPSRMEAYIEEEIEVYRTTREVIEQRYECKDAETLEALGNEERPVIEVLLWKPAIAYTVMQCFRVLAKTGTVEADYPREIVARYIPSATLLASAESKTMDDTTMPEIGLPSLSFTTQTVRKGEERNGERRVSESRACVVS